MDSILTPSEMDALLKPSAEQESYESEQDVKPVDLVTRDHQAFAMLPQINEAGKELAVQIGQVCDRLLRITCQTEAAPVEVMPASRLPDLLGTPRFVFNLRSDTQPSAGLLSIDGVLGSAFVEREFGGDLLDFQEDPSPPTTVESQTAARLATHLVKTLKAVIGNISTVNLTIEQTTPALLSPTTHGVSVVLFAVNVGIGEYSSRVGIALDTSTAGFRMAGPAVRFTQEDGPLRAPLEKVNVSVSAVLGHAHLSLGQLMTIKPGDLLPLETFDEGEATFLIEGRPKYRGTPTIHKGILSVQLVKEYRE